MHNGVFTTLAEVVNFYDKGGGKRIGLKVESQTLSGDSLGLTLTEKNALVAFLHALTDSSFINYAPQKLAVIAAISDRPY